MRQLVEKRVRDAVQAANFDLLLEFDMTDADISMMPDEQLLDMFEMLSGYQE